MEERAQGICVSPYYVALEVKQCHLRCVLFARSVTQASQLVVRGRGIRTLISMGKFSEKIFNHRITIITILCEETEASAGGRVCLAPSLLA